MEAGVIEMRSCWCGNTELAPFGRGYADCRVCGTLVYMKEISSDQLLVRDDEKDFYGKNYWLERQQDTFGHDDIHVRARNDLTERNLHWLNTVLKYCLPPARVLEIGCAHASFVGLLRQAGYDASGVEMSPWVVSLGQDMFGVPVQAGPVETLDIPASSFDVIVLMDVLEHLPDPVTTMRRCLELLKPDGILLIQTPQFESEVGYEALVDSKNRFQEMMIPEEHIHLFSQKSAQRLFSQLGAAHIHFENAIFAHYDMFFAVSRSPFKTTSLQEREAVLLASPPGRFVQALLDLRKREMDLIRRLEESEADRAARHEQLEILTNIIKKGRTGRIARLKKLEALEADLQELLRTPSLKLFAKFFRRSGLLRLFKRYEQPMHKTLRTIAVDLTPMLPGGENGGAKIFVLELLEQLAKMAPETEFVLLTHAASHEELVALERKNMRRMLIVDPSRQTTLRSHARWAARVFPHLPNRLRNIASRIGYKLNSILRRRYSRSLLWQIEADLLFCPFTAPIYAEPNIPTVCTIYDLQYKSYPEFFSVEDVAQRDRTFFEACRKASALAAISNYSRNSAIHHGKLEAEHIRTIQLRMAKPARDRESLNVGILDRLSLQPQKYLLYPANFWRHKNHEMLFTAFNIACRNGLPEEIKLVCTGAPGERQQFLMSAVESMGLADRIIFPGYLPKDDLATLLGYSAGVVFPSLYEGFGLPVIEAMAAGVPVACSDRTSLPEVASGAALLFDPRIPTDIAQKLLSLVQDESLRSQYIEAGKERAKEFMDVKRMAEEYWNLFRLAQARGRHFNLLSGAYQDGWAGPAIHIQIAPSSRQRTLEIELAAPEWLPKASLHVKVHRDGGVTVAPLEIVRGASATWSIPLECVGGRYMLDISPTFIPARLGQGSDQRELSALLQRCGIVCGNGEYIELFPQKETA